MNSSHESKKIGVVGIGRLGICLALNFSKSNHQVIGYDVNEELIKSIKDKTYESEEPLVETYLDKHPIKVTTEFDSVIKFAEFIYIVVPTPSLQDGRYDHSIIDGIVADILKHNQPEERKTVVINSTTMPGYCESIVKQLNNHNYDLVYNPEFVAQGNIINDQTEPHMILVGSNDRHASRQIVNLVSTLNDKSPPAHITTLTEAELVKISVNCFLTTKIALANQIGDLAIRLGCGSATVLNAIASDRRIGKSFFNWGYGYGGPCLPRDNKAFLNLSQAYGMLAPINSATDIANQEHHKFLVEYYKSFGKPVEFFGITYNNKSTMIEESPKLAVALELVQAGIPVTIVEKTSVIDKLLEKFGALFTYREKA